MREHGVASLEQVEAIVLESDGRFAVILKQAGGDATKLRDLARRWGGRPFRRAPCRAGSLARLVVAEHRHVAHAGPAHRLLSRGVLCDLVLLGSALRITNFGLRLLLLGEHGQLLSVR
jgi:hypothetical protein